jgi:hypothetical protein
MTTIEFIEDNTGELAQQALDDGYQAVEVAIGEDGVKTLVEAHNKAQARIRELEAARELWRKSEQGTLAQMAETNERFEAALSTIRELEAQLAAQNIRANERVADALKDRADMVDRAVKAEAQLAEANYRVQVHSDIAAENNLLRCKAEARAEAAHKAKRIAEDEQLKAAAELDEANARAEAMRAALEAAMSRWKKHGPGDVESDTVWRQAQVALAPTPAESEVK